MPTMPSRAFHRNFWATFMIDTIGIELRHHMNIDHLMWSTDYPHTGTDWPNNRVSIERNFRGVESENLFVDVRDARSSDPRKDWQAWMNGFDRTAWDGMYRDLLREHAAANGVAVWSWVLMPNHVHLILVPEQQDSLRAALSKEPGANLFLVPVQDIRIGGRQSNAQYQYTLQGDDLAELRTWEPKIRAALSNLPELADVNTDTQDKGLQTSLVIDRDTASKLGVTTRMIDATLNDVFGQRIVSTIYNPLNQYRVVMEAAPQYWQNPETLRDIYVRSTNDVQVPLSAFTHFAPATTALAVNHQGQFPAVTLSFNLAPGAALGDATLAIERVTLCSAGWSSGVSGAPAASASRTAAMLAATCPARRG